METRRQKIDKLKNECLTRQCMVLIQKLPNEGISLSIMKNNFAQYFMCLKSYKEFTIPLYSKTTNENRRIESKFIRNAKIQRRNSTKVKVGRIDLIL